MSPRRNLKNTEDGIEKGRTEQSGYQFKKYQHPCKKLSSKTIYAVETAGREIDEASMRKALKKITNAIKKPAIIRTRQEINEHTYSVL
jgi:hypothetical protein